MPLLEFSAQRLDSRRVVRKIPNKQIIKTDRQTKNEQADKQKYKQCHVNKLCRVFLDNASLKNSTKNHTKSCFLQPSGFNYDVFAVTMLIF